MVTFRTNSEAIYIKQLLRRLNFIGWRPCAFALALDNFTRSRIIYAYLNLLLAKFL